MGPRGSRPPVGGQHVGLGAMLLSPCHLGLGSSVPSSPPHSPGRLPPALPANLGSAFGDDCHAPARGSSGRPCAQPGSPLPPASPPPAPARPLSTPPSPQPHRPEFPLPIGCYLGNREQRHSLLAQSGLRHLGAGRSVKYPKGTRLTPDFRELRSRPARGSLAEMSTPNRTEPNLHQTQQSCPDLRSCQWPRRGVSGQNLNAALRCSFVNCKAPERANGSLFSATLRQTL